MHSQFYIKNHVFSAKTGSQAINKCQHIRAAMLAVEKYIWLVSHAFIRPNKKACERMEHPRLTTRRITSNTEDYF